MTLREEQSEFCKDVSKLISWTFENGYEITFGEALRTADQQLLYFEGLSLTKIGATTHLVKAPRKTKTLNSKHLNKLAIDLNVFIDGDYVTEKSKLQPIGDYWESLSPENQWGGNWQTFLDTPHFQRGK